MVVLDEADEMLSMGFKDDLDFILERTKSDRQNMLISATISKEVKSISKRYIASLMIFDQFIYKRNNNFNSSIIIYF